MPSVIPAFYCCYLLRSQKKNAQPYVGSTPNILRRWKQHNGMLPGGAVQTSREGSRPWNVACIVHGFPSRSAALQFEWAWQHPHSTRHVAREERLVSNGQSATGPLKRPRASLTKKVAELHLLLRTSSFESWPLAVTFFSEEAHKAWNLWDERSSNHLRPGIAVTVDFRKETMEARAVSPSKSRSPTKRIMYPIPVVLADIDVKYSSLKSHLEKSTVAVKATTLTCSACSTQMDTAKELILVCPHDGCTAVSHLSCLSTGSISKTPESYVPFEVACPQCTVRTNWATLMKELNLRVYNSCLVNKILKPSKSNKTNDPLSDGDIDLDDDDFWALQRGSDSDDAYDSHHDSNDFIPIEDFAEDYIPTSAQYQPPPSPMIIPDSESETESNDWNDVEVLD